MRLSFDARACLLAAIAFGSLAPTAAFGAIADALDRPALLARSPEHSVLLAAALAGHRIVAVGERGLVLLSDDEGRHWRQSQTPVSVTLTSIRFADARTGMVVGHSGCVLVTRDAGLTWTAALDGRQIARLYVDAAKSRGDADELKSAARLLADGADKPLLDLLLTPGGHALVVGAYGIALVTEDGGRTWSPWGTHLDNPKGLHLYAVRQRGSRVVVVGEQGLLLISGDGGDTFRKTTTPYRGSFFAVELPSDEGIVVAGLRGNVWQSFDDGRGWRSVATTMPVSITGTSLDADGTLYFANQAGFLLVQDGDHTRIVNPTPLSPLNALLPLGRTQMLALGGDGPNVVSTPIRGPK